MDQPSLPPNVALIQIATSGLAAKALWVAAELGVADHILGDGTAVDVLAQKTGADADALYRILRLLASLGVFREEEGRRFAHNEASALLRQEHPSRLRAAIRMIVGGPMWSATGELMHSARTGQTGFEKANGLPVFPFLEQHPHDAAIFNDAMVGFHGDEPPAVASAYDFSGVKSLVDVGGGTGNLIIHILRRHPHLKGTIYDLPHVADAAAKRLADEGLADRCRVESGSFFERVPAGADAYTLSHIIHDWDEASCLKILGNCRDAMKPGGRVLLVEMIIPGPNEPHPGKLLDLIMLAVPGGRERTPAEYEALFKKAGLRLQKVIPTASPVSIVEAARP